MTRPGLRPFIANIKHKSTPEPIEIEPMWTIRELQKFFQKGRTAIDDFLKSNPDFPRVKIGSQWRFDPDSVKVWIKSNQIRGERT